jgi:hypothetical protein
MFTPTGVLSWRVHIACIHYCGAAYWKVFICAVSLGEIDFGKNTYSPDFKYIVNGTLEVDPHSTISQKQDY